MAEQELAIYRALGDKGLPVSSALHTLGGIQVHLGAWSDAKRSLDEALAIRAEKVGGESNEVAVVLNALADLALAQRRPAEALPLYVKALETRLKAGNATPEARAADLLGQGRSLVMLGRPAEAVVPLQQADELTKAVEETSVVAATKLELGRALWLSDPQRRDEAKTLMLASYDRVRADERRDAEAWMAKLGVLVAPSDGGVP
jgi:tetratricopeptide (TPR) repeat protein